MCAILILTDGFNLRKGYEYDESINSLKGTYKQTIAHNHCCFRIYKSSGLDWNQTESQANSQPIQMTVRMQAHFLFQ
jgi:hypothetical protein